MARLSPAQKAAYEQAKAEHGKVAAGTALKVKKEKVVLPVVPPEPEVILTNEERIVPVLSDQHPIAGLIGEVFMELGGKDFMRSWAEENPSRFMQMVVKQQPAFNPITEKSSTITIKIENSLGRTALDDDNVVSYQ
jgi:hypothetical protein